MTPEEYTELAKCTEPDSVSYEGAISRARANWFKICSTLNDVDHYSKELDTLKRAVYYAEEHQEYDPDDPRSERINEQTIRLLHAAMGLATEAGEFIEALIAHIEHGEELDLVNLAEEIGDVEWYSAIGSDTTGVPLSKIMYTNIKKLEKRFGSKFNTKGALIRKLDEERAILDDMK